MEKHKKILATLDTARTGARVLEKDWDQKIVPRTLKQIAKKYNLLGTCDPNNPVNTDGELADRFFLCVACRRIKLHKGSPNKSGRR